MNMNVLDLLTDVSIYDFFNKCFFIEMLFFFFLFYLSIASLQAQFK